MEPRSAQFDYLLEEDPMAGSPSRYNRDNYNQYVAELSGGDIADQQKRMDEIKAKKE